MPSIHLRISIHPVNIPSHLSEYNTKNSLPGDKGTIWARSCPKRRYHYIGKALRNIICAKGCNDLSAVLQGRNAAISSLMSASAAEPTPTNRMLILHYSSKMSAKARFAATRFVVWSNSLQHRKKRGRYRTDLIRPCGFQQRPLENRQLKPLDRALGCGRS